MTVFDTTEPFIQVWGIKRADPGYLSIIKSHSMEKLSLCMKAMHYDIGQAIPHGHEVFG